ncbi:MAG: RsiV family protein [Gammaproteobacteria bacterium]|nr:RsiV family protein [Gammaproteobacteria bacterium]
MKDEFYHVPMAHPSVMVKTINVDAKKQRLLEFSDVFTNTEKALTIIARVSEDCLIEKLHAEVSEKNMSRREEFIRIGTRPLAENYQHWNIHQNFFEVTFDRAQVAPSYYGLQTVDIPLSFLREVLNPYFFNKSQQTP